MKILVAYYSNTGNTEKVAKAIADALASEESKLLPVKDVDPSTLGSYDLVILGSGIYASKVHASITKMMKAVESFPPKFAFFCTHASENMYQDGFKAVFRLIKNTDSSIIGEFDCMGENLGIPKEQTQKMLESLPLEQRKKAEEHQEKLKGRPNEEDLENAKEFAKTLI
jgi:flavodoxin I